MDNHLDLYMQSLGRVPLLDADQEVSLSKKIEAGLYAGHLLATGQLHPTANRTELAILAEDGSRARDHLITANLRLVVAVARDYQDRGLTLPDLIQEGNTGLVRAADHYDWRRGVRFATYALWWIRSAILTALAATRPIRLPADCETDLRAIRATEAELLATTGYPPSTATLAAHTGIPEDRIIQLLWLDHPPLRLDQPLSGDRSTTIADLIADPTADVERIVHTRIDAKQRRQVVEDALAALPEQEQQVVRLRYGLDTGHPLHWDAVADRLGIPARTARQLANRALRRLRWLATHQPRLQQHLLATGT